MIATGKKIPKVTRSTVYDYKTMVLGVLGTTLNFYKYFFVKAIKALNNYINIHKISFELTF